MQVSNRLNWFLLSRLSDDEKCQDQSDGEPNKDCQANESAVPETSSQPILEEAGSFHIEGSNEIKTDSPVADISTSAENGDGVATPAKSDCELSGSDSSSEVKMNGPV